MSKSNKKLWGGRFSESTDKAVERFTCSLDDDQYLFKADIKASIVHSRALAKVGLITDQEADKLENTLNQVLVDKEFTLNAELEDIHMNIEFYLIDKLGDLGKKIHTGRSRNDQVITAFKITIKDNLNLIKGQLIDLCMQFVKLADKYIDIIIPGYTHLQKAQPISLSHYYLAYFEKFFRDLQKLEFFIEQMNVLPLGVGSLAGIPYDIDRDFVAKELGFSSVSNNSLDTVSERDFVLDAVYVFSTIMMHLSRFSEDMIIWSSDEFGFITISDRYTTGSSIMPQKKNPDVCELTRGKCGRVYGQLMSLLTTLKGLPMTYNRDLQEDKHSYFEAYQTLTDALQVNIGMLKEIKINRDNINKQLSRGFLTATDFADYLVGKGIPFRESHSIVGRLVSKAINENKQLNELNLLDFKTVEDRIEQDVYKALEIQESLNVRNSFGGTAPIRIREQINLAKKRLKEL